MTPVSAHFSLEEVTHSQTAARLGINNDLPVELLPSVKKAALGMELVRKALNGNAVIVSSWYRCEALEKSICAAAYKQWCLKHGKYDNTTSWAEYFNTKAHPKGFAIDFTCPTAGTPEQIIRVLLKANIPFQQIIYEYSSWVHISFNGEAKQALVIDNSGTRVFV
jgi:zinc D-Ala-D-Ala carboxypeptidase